MKHILIVDDKPENLYLLERMLKSGGYETTSASNGAEALDMALNNPPNLIIADILMPIMDGFALCREWRKSELLQKIPFVFYTATYTDPKDEEFALSLGADRFVTKPMEMSMLLKIIHETIDSYQAQELHSVPALQPEEKVFLKEYNEALVRKLEDKMTQVEAVEKELREKNAALEKDIENRKKVEEELRESEETFRALFEQIADGVLVIDVQTLKFIFGNPQICRMLEYKINELMDLGLEDIHLREDLPHVKSQFEQLLHRETDLVLDIPVKRKNGSIFYVDISASPIAINKRKCMMGVFHDVTERKKTEENNSKLNEELEKKVEEKTKELQERIIELERFHDATIDRELRMKEMRDEIERLRGTS